MPNPDTRDLRLIDTVLNRHDLALLIGAPMAGKTTLLMQLLAALQQPDPDFFGLKAAPHLRIGLLTCDQAPGSYEETAHDVGADLSQVRWFSQQRDADLTQQKLFTSRDKDEPFQYFLETMDRLYAHGIDLFIVEPFTSWLNCNIVDNRHTSHRMAALTTWLQRRACGILATVHQGKAVTSKQFYRPVDRVLAAQPVLGHCSAALVLDLGNEISKRPTTPTIARLSVVKRHNPGVHIWIDRDPAGSPRWIPSNPANAILNTGPTTRQLDLLAFIEREGECLRGKLKRFWLPKQNIKSEKTLDRDLIALAQAGRIVNDRPGGLPTSPYRAVMAGGTLASPDVPASPEGSQAPAMAIPEPVWIPNDAPDQFYE